MRLHEVDQLLTEETFGSGTGGHDDLFDLGVSDALDQLG